MFDIHMTYVSLIFTLMYLEDKTVYSQSVRFHTYHFDGTTKKRLVLEQPHARFMNKTGICIFHFVLRLFKQFMAYENNYK